MSLYPWERPLGARVTDDGQVEVRVWAHSASAVTVELAGSIHALTDEGFGIWSATVPGGHGDRYTFSLDGGDGLPDPASRWQPAGLRGPSAVVDTATFPRTASVELSTPDLVVYELHVGTFSPEGTFDGAIAYLTGLAELGVTAIEVMPVAEFPGRFGWGYDGVFLSAAQSSYGGPEAFARLVDAAHAVGLGVILDVVYNHVGASGEQNLRAFGPYFTDKYSTFWGGAINYDDEGCDPVREWVLQSAEGWVRDFGVDGLRLDAIHAIYDGGARPILREIATRVHAAHPGAIVIAESGMNDPKVTQPVEEGGDGHDAAWADDLHHAVRTLLTGDREGYYAEFGEVSDLVACYDRPFLHDGTYSTFRGRRFGAPAGDRPVHEFVVFTQDHDQVGNRALGDRLATELLPLAAFAVLLSPFVPMLWMGEEHAEPAPFQFFADHIDPDIATATREGRRREFASFAAFAGEEVPDPGDPATFERSKLTRQEDPAIKALYRDLLALRKQLPHGDAQAFGDDEDGWVRLHRGCFELCMNFTESWSEVPCSPGGEVVLTTHDGVELGPKAVRLPPRAGAAVRIG